MSQPILQLEGVTVETTDGGPAPLLEDISLELEVGDVIGVVGEAGAGKTLLVRTVLQLLPENLRLTRGRVRLKGTDLGTLSEAELRRLRGTELAPILPDAKSQLNPLLRVGDMMTAVLRTREKVSRKEARERAAVLLQTVGITDPTRRLEAYPHELSGGMAQRVCIALALMHSPSVIIADEPTAGLDVTVQRQVMDLMAGLVRARDAAQLIVTRDLGIVAHYCGRVAVMRGGRIVEMAPTIELFDSPRHPHTRELLKAARREGVVRRSQTVAERA
ncbi:MAG TPA: ABC transporter ATP-binding protein [Candidatus Dormibacteraeota bacterium]|nr:ABC transporter ATP-binding protein [Candidatus Dormibacteraeota bacterium]